MRLDKLIEVLGTYDPPPGYRIDAVVVVTERWLMITTSDDGGEITQHDALRLDGAWTIERGAA